MSAEERLLDVIAKTAWGMPAHKADQFRDDAQHVLDALREAITDDWTLIRALWPKPQPLADEEIAAGDRTMEQFKELLALGGAVRTTTSRQPPYRGTHWIQRREKAAWNDCLDAIYTAAGVERP